MNFLETLLEAAVMVKCISKTCVWRNKKGWVESQIWLTPVLVPSVDLFMGYEAGEGKHTVWL